MKQKTLGQIFALLTIVMTFAVSAYVLYYVFVGDVANFNMLAFCSGGVFMITLIPLFVSLSEYCEEDEEIKK